MQIPREKAREIMKTIKDMFYELGDAEALELNLRKRIKISQRKYLRLINKKAADVEAVAKIGAILGNTYRVHIENLAKYGRLLGNIFLLYEDYVDVMDMKEMLHRLRKEHLPLLLVNALRIDPTLREKIVLLQRRQNRKILIELQEKAIDCLESYRRVMMNFIKRIKKLTISYPNSRQLNLLALTYIP